MGYYRRRNDRVEPRSRVVAVAFDAANVREAMATLAPRATGTPPARALPKSATGISGLDEITLGGFPRGRPTLICGAAGCGKTLLAMEFIVRGATQFDEPGVFVAFEERPEELTANVRSLGFDLDALAEQKKIAVEHIHVERSEIEETGDYDLEALFLRLGVAIDSIGAKRIVLDTIEALFASFSNHAILRAELMRLFRFLKGKGVTAVITCERGEGNLSRHGLEEYVSDCVILLDHRVQDQISTRRLRIVKYRGSAHGSDEYPFLIDEHGFSVLPISSLGLTHQASNERISSGVPQLDAMLGGAGLYRGSTVLVSGTAGTGKTSLAAHFARATCERGERCLYMAFEESPHQLARNMRSIGLELEPWLKRDLIRIHASRPTLYGIEMHLATMHKLIADFAPAAIIVDPISNLTAAASLSATNSMLLRLIDFAKSQQITAFLTSLTSGNTDRIEQTDIGISSMVDTWLLLRDIEINGERNRGLHVLKSRGMAHSNQVREFLLTNTGIELREAYIGAEGVLTGSSRLAQEAKEAAAATRRQQAIEHKRRDLERKRKALEVKVAALRAEFEAEQEDVQHIIQEDQIAEGRLDRDRADMARSRRAENIAAPTRTKGDHK